MDKRLGRVKWGPHGERHRTGATTWRDPAKWNRWAEAEGTRPFVFCASLADVFDNKVPAQWRRDAFDVMRETPRLVYLLLTKRPQNIIRLTEEAGGLPPNVALGTTVEDQDRADMNVPALLQAKAALRPLFVFLSCEPLLGPIDLTEITEGDGTMDALQPRRWEDEMETWRETSDTWEEDFTDWFGLHELPDPGPMHPGLDWVITGGETDQGSHRARPTNPQWIRDIRDQCAAAGVPYHHKQNGEWVSVSEVEGEGDHYHFPDGRTVRRVGKALSGRTIDLVTHDAFPEVPAL